MKKQNFPRVEPRVSSAYEVGAILEDQWGWEQTNVDFYCIVSISPSSGFCVVMPMKKNQSEMDGSMSRKESPAEIDYSANPIRKKIKKNKETGEFYGFSLRDYAGGGWCNLWNGRESTSTHYA